MIDFLNNSALMRHPELIGMVVTGITGLLVPWISRRSVNYKKINKRLLISSLIYFGYFTLVQIVVVFIGTVIAIAFQAEIENDFVFSFTAVAIMTIIALFIFWLIMIKSKRMKELMVSVRDVSRKLFLLLNGVAYVSMVFAFIYLLFMDTTIGRGMEILSWMISFGWFYLMAVVVWKTSEYIYSQMKITLLDGEIVTCDCNPRMYRVHRNYIRLLTRDARGVVVHERQINEIAIKQIEYLK